MQMIQLFKTYIDFRFQETSPLKLMVVSAGAAYSVAKIQHFLEDDEYSKKN